MPSRAEKPRDGVSLATLKRRAHGRVKSMLKAGLLSKPDLCAKCSRDPGMGKDGRSLLQGHHHKGYEHPTEVEWLCVQCHRDETPSNPRRGEAAISAKLTEEDVRNIRASALGYKRLSQLYGVHPMNIKQIKERKTWAHVQ